MLLDRRSRERGIIDPAAVERLIAAHAAGTSARARDAIWSLLNLELWYRTFIDGDGVQTLPCGGHASARREPPRSNDAPRRLQASA